MEHKLKKMMKKMEDVLAAVSFAEEGESDAARALLKDGGRVLLALREERIDAKTVKYAKNTSKRINADLDILSVSSLETPGKVDPLMENLQSELAAEGIRFRLIKKTGCLKQAIIEYTNKEKEILFAVVESTGSLERDCNKKDFHLSELWQRLKCPLVVVMEEGREKKAAHS